MAQIERGSGCDLYELVLHFAGDIDYLVELETELTTDHNWNATFGG